MTKRLENIKSLAAALFVLVSFTGIITAQEADYTVRIKQPVGDTIKSCPGKTIIFMAEGLNADGKAFDPNQVTFTWDFGYNGQIRTGPTVTWNYPEGGHFLIRLYVTGLAGPAAKNIPEIHVFCGMKPWFTGTRPDQPSFCSGSEITLTGFVNPVKWTGDDFPFTNTFAPADYTWDGSGMQSNRNGIARIKPPLDKGHMKYVFRVADNFGCFYDTTLTLFGVYSTFDMEPLTGEAPLEVRFDVDSSSNGGSENSITYQWEFYENTDTSKLLTSTQNLFKFEIPGQYTSRMTAKYQQCTYSSTHKEYIRVDSSLLEIPNVFTPNEDGANDFFQVKGRSLKTFHGVIFNRWGRPVFEWTDPKTLENGWNGKFENTGADCPSGTYYYVIKATGWDKNKTESKTEDGEYPDIIYQGGVYKGFLTLIR